MMNLSGFFSQNPNKTTRMYAVGTLLVLFAAAAGILLGSTPLSLSEIAEAITGGADSSAGARILLFVRLPRTAAALLCGAALAVSGAVIQGVLSNRLASPSIIGVNSGAGLAVTVCAACGIYGGWRLSMLSFCGAFLTVISVSLCAKKWGASRGTIILIGVAANSLLGAFSDAIVTFSPEVGLLSNDFKVGDFSAVTLQKLLPACVLVLLSVLVLLTLHNELDVLTLGDENARGLGMNTSLMRLLFLLLAAMLAGCAVSLAGLLSFVGLIVPHIVRRFAGGRSKSLLSLCALFGAAFVSLCDTIARTAFAPYEIPVGIIMAFLGAPFFLFILFQKQRRKEP